MRLILSLFLLWLLIACSANGTGITREVAIQRASAIAYGGPELSASEVPLANLNAERMTLSEVGKRIGQANNIAKGKDPQRSVWLVTMDGLWHAGMAVPKPDPHPIHHFTVIIDATTGDSLGRVGTP